MQQFDFSLLLKYAKQNNISLPEKVIEHLNIYANLLLEWNEKINLTAITEPEEVIIKHFIDSISVLKHLNAEKVAKVIDVGTGAGFPGMVLKIIRPDLDITLLDGHAKRFIFLEDLQNKIGLKTNNLHIRAELASKDNSLRENFDIAIARAVARLPVLAEYCLPFVKVGGTFFAMKGPDAENECNEAKNALSILGGTNAELFKEDLPKDNKRIIIMVKKKAKTPEKYPRASAQISKKPL